MADTADINSAVAGTPVVDLAVPLDMAHPGAQPFLESIQGNILKAHARDHALHLLIRCGGDVAASRAWLADFVAKHMTTGAVQKRQIALFKSGADSGPFAMIALSHSGMAALGVADADKPADLDFKNGLKNPGLKSDPPFAQWETPYQGDVHAIVILADQDESRLVATGAAMTVELTEAGATVHAERGDAIIASDPRYGRQNKVHFGFADGLSQPELVKQDIDNALAENGRDHWNPGAALNLLFLQDLGGYGSYLVFRKLEQNVRGFYEAERQIATAFGLGMAGARAVEAMIVGRYRNGEPAIAQTPKVPSIPGNDFNFDEDRFGVVCPYHAHIRRTNPRGDLSSPGIGRPPLDREKERGFRIARRGIPYGSADYMGTMDAGSYPTGGVGLLFMSFQSKLVNFTIQQDGSDDDDFPLPAVGVDAIIGRSATPRPQHWYKPDGATLPGGPAGELRFTMANFVTLAGGEYFYAPSPGFLRSMVA